MKELWGAAINTYHDYRGTGKVLALFLVSVLIICIVNGLKSKDGENVRVINPLLFILSPIAGIGYAFTLAYERYLERAEGGNGKERAVSGKVFIGLLILLTLTLSGRLVFIMVDIDGWLPFIPVPIYMGIYILLAGRLFENRGLKRFMILCICVLNLWGYQSEALLPVTMLSGRFSIPAAIVHGVLPLILWWAVDKYEKYMECAPLAVPDDKEELDYYEWEEEDMKNHKIINSRNLAIALLIVVVLLAGSIFVMNRKINNLYETTVNLQQQVNEMQK